MKKYFALVLAVTVPMLVGCSKHAKPEDPVQEADAIINDVEGTPATASAAQTGNKPGQMTSVAQAGQTGQAVLPPEGMAPGMDSMADSGNLEKPSIQNIQEALKNAGLYNGEVDGVLGPKTKKAVREFQTMNNLSADGKVGRKTWLKLQPYLSGAVPAPTPTTTDVSN